MHSLALRPPSFVPFFEKVIQSLFLLLLLGGCTGIGTHPDDLLLRDAYLARETGDLDQALVVAEELREGERHRDEARELLAAIHRQKARGFLAEFQFQEAYDHFLIAADAGLMRARRARDLRGALEASDHLGLSIEEQRQLIRRVLNDDPRDLQLHRKAARLSEELQDRPTAIEHYLYLYSANPGDLRAALRLGVLYQAENRYRDAARVLEEVHLQEPENIQAAFTLLSAWVALHRHTEATNLFEELLRRYPQQPSVYLRFAAYLEEQGHTSRAEQLRYEAQELLPSIEGREMRPLN